MANKAEQYQYIKLPDGSYGKFLSTATDDQIRSAITQAFPTAYEPIDANPNKEGTYKMKDAQGKEHEIPYSKVGTPGYSFTNDYVRDRYNNDATHDPNRVQTHIEPLRTPTSPTGSDFLHPDRNAPLPSISDMDKSLQTSYPVGVQGESLQDNLGNTLHNVGVGGYSVLRHPIDTLNAINPLNYIADTAHDLYTGGAGDSRLNEYSIPRLAYNLENNPGGTIPQMVGGAAMLNAVADAPGNLKDAIPEIPGAKSLGEWVQKPAGALIRDTVGPYKKDQGNPSLGYFQGRLKPATSMRDIANQAAEAKSKVGNDISNELNGISSSRGIVAFGNPEGVNMGTPIPRNEVMDAIRAPYQDISDTMTGPFGTGDETLNSRMERFGALSPNRPYTPLTEEQFNQVGNSDNPLLNPYLENLSPRDVWDIKRNVADNVNWQDASNALVNNAGQRIAGKLSGVLQEHVPALTPMFETYENLSPLEERARYRADTGQEPLSRVMRKNIFEPIGGAASLFGVTHNPWLGVAGGAAARLLDTVPVKTAAGVGLNEIGEWLKGNDDRYMPGYNNTRPAGSAPPSVMDMFGIPPENRNKPMVIGGVDLPPQSGSSRSMQEYYRQKAESESGNSVNYGDINPTVDRIWNKYASPQTPQTDEEWWNSHIVPLNEDEEE